MTQELDSIKKVFIYNTINNNNTLKKRLLEIYTVNKNRTNKEITEAFRNRIKDFYNMCCHGTERLILAYCEDELLYTEILELLP